MYPVCLILTRHSEPRFPRPPKCSALCYQPPFATATAGALSPPGSLGSESSRSQAVPGRSCFSCKIQKAGFYRKSTWIYLSAVGNDIGECLCGFGAVCTLPPCVTRHLWADPRRKRLRACWCRDAISMVDATAAMYISMQFMQLLPLHTEQQDRLWT